MPALSTVLTTDSNGEAEWAYSYTLDDTPAVCATPVDANTGDSIRYAAAITASTASGCTVQVWKMTTTVVAGISLLAASTPAVGVAVNIIATELFDQPPG